MRDEDKTKEHLIHELMAVRRRIAELEASETRRKRTEEKLRQYREHLEDLVDQRTAELRRTNEHLEQEITERKRAEEQIRRYSETLEAQVRKRTERIQELERQRAESEKLAATGHMAACIAHEINNPLGGIKNSFLLIKDAIPDDHPYYEYIGRLEREIDRIARIVRQMFELYRPDQESAGAFTVNETIRDVVFLLQASGRKQDVHIAIETPDAPVVAIMPKGSLTQVLFNIVGNAIEASQPGDMVKIAMVPDRDVLTITVSDQGSGIPEEICSRIFEPFFTTKDGLTAGGRLGLGLSVSKSLVQTMGGSLQFQSQVGQGTVFQIILPRYRAGMEGQND